MGTIGDAEPALPGQSVSRRGGERGGRRGALFRGNAGPGGDGWADGGLRRLAGRRRGDVDATADGTATAGSDYTTTSGTLTFAAGERSKTVSVPITDDSLEDEGETLTLRLSKAPLPAASVRTSGGASVVMPRTALMNSRPHRTKDCCAGALVGRPDK